jgi:hypothetical protein
MYGHGWVTAVSAAGLAAVVHSATALGFKPSVPLDIRNKTPTPIPALAAPKKVAMRRSQIILRQGAEQDEHCAAIGRESEAGLTLSDGAVFTTLAGLLTSRLNAISAAFATIRKPF